MLTAVHRSHLPNPQLYDAMNEMPTEADRIKEVVAALTRADATAALRVEALAELQALVEPIDNANGGAAGRAEGRKPGPARRVCGLSAVYRYCSSRCAGAPDSQADGAN